MGRIYYKNYLDRNAIKMIDELHELLDIKSDFEQIRQAELTINTVNGELRARKLDAELRHKYPIINKMLAVANTFPSIPTIRSQTSVNYGITTLERLQQDACGIKCHVLLKKGFIKSVEEYIDHVD